MPIFDYSCRGCKHQFEALVRRGEEPVCPACGSADLERLLSLPTVKSESTKALSMRAAQRRDKAQGTERVQEQIRYEQSHND
ncbi:MAG: FmdB family zinc ribbon protein [Gemmatimonadaceae bacterium]